MSWTFIWLQQFVGFEPSAWMVLYAEQGILTFNIILSFAYVFFLCINLFCHVHEFLCFDPISALLYNFVFDIEVEII